MNKLVLAATLALTLGSYVNAQGQCELPTPGPTYGALVYDLTINVKTTKAKPGKEIKAGCEITDTPCYRVKASRTFKGLLAYCATDCGGFQADASVWVWEQKSKTVLVDGTAAPFSIFWRIGHTTLGKSKDMEVQWGFEDADYAFDGQGYGTWDTSKGLMKKANGNTIGLLAAPVLETNKPINDDGDCECVGLVYVCADGWQAEAVDTEHTIAFGSWSLKYNKSASAKYVDGYLPFPKWY